MNDILALSLPFFGLIFLGFAVGKLAPTPPGGLAGLNFFVLYLALPALFFQLLARTPIADLTNWAFVLTTTLSTFLAFAAAFGLGMVINRGNIAESTIQGMAGGYANIGYMAPGLTLAAFGAGASVPTALIFCFDNAMLFTLAPLMMAIGGTEKHPPLAMAGMVLKRIFLHPFILATIVGVGAAAIRFTAPAPVDQLLTLLKNAAAPCALFAMGVTIAMRPVRRVPVELPGIVLVKLILHPAIVYVLLSWVGGFPQVWIDVAVVTAALPTAANVFVLAQQYGTYVERASTTILATTALGVVTVTGILYLIGNRLLPGDLFP